jgi:3-deoxy-D-manno-octulosonate 8-phosphate phosphatase (KDO 8-P phosphatase)
MEKQHFLEKLQHIKAFVFDVDGVFTNNQLIATESGDLMRSFNAKDGFALKTAIERGYHYLYYYRWNFCCSSQTLRVVRRSA